MTTKISFLARRYQELQRAAESTGQTQAYELARGARIGVRVQAGQIEVCFSRRNAPVGDVELATFTRHCGVPVGASRVPVEGQLTHTERNSTRHYVIYRWPVTIALPLEDERV